MTQRPASAAVIAAAAITVLGILLAVTGIQLSWAVGLALFSVIAVLSWAAAGRQSTP